MINSFISQNSEDYIMKSQKFTKVTGLDPTTDFFGLLNSLDLKEKKHEVIKCYKLYFSFSIDILL